jgi:Pyruvate/2-oxoacid:ferredoxin oxidoreductase delta subunit
MNDTGMRSGAMRSTIGMRAYAPGARICARQCSLEALDMKMPCV